MEDFDWEKDKREYEEFEAILEKLGPTLDASRKLREELSRVEVPDNLAELEAYLNRQLDTSDIQKPLELEKAPYHHETRPAYGEHGAWQEWYIDHNNCGGTWIYIKDPCNPRVVCSCSMGLS